MADAGIFSLLERTIGGTVRFVPRFVKTTFVTLREPLRVITRRNHNEYSRPFTYFTVAYFLLALVLRAMFQEGMDSLWFSFSTEQAAGGALGALNSASTRMLLANTLPVALLTYSSGVLLDVRVRKAAPQTPEGTFVRMALFVAGCQFALFVAVLVSMMLLSLSDILWEHIEVTAKVTIGLMIAASFVWTGITLSRAVKLLVPRGAPLLASYSLAWFLWPTMVGVGLGTPYVLNAMEQFLHPTPKYHYAQVTPIVAEKLNRGVHMTLLLRNTGQEAFVLRRCCGVARFLDNNSLSYDSYLPSDSLSFEIVSWDGVDDRALVLDVGETAHMRISCLTTEDVSHALTERIGRELIVFLKFPIYTEFTEMDRFVDAMSCSVQLAGDQ